jgi:hypothetical protein
MHGDDVLLRMPDCCMHDEGFLQLWLKKRSPPLAADAAPHDSAAL